MMKRIIFGLILFVLILVAVILISEFVLGAYARFINKKSQLNLNSYKVDKEELASRGMELNNLFDPENKNGFFKNSEVLYKPSVLFGYEYKPSQGIINSYGLLGQEYSLDKDEGVYRILLLGDSLAASNVESVILEWKLNNFSPWHSEHRFEIWNAAVPSWNIQKYAIFLKHKGIKYNPDMVLVFLCLNDLHINDILMLYKIKGNFVSYNFPKSELVKIIPLSPFLLRHSYLYRLVVFSLESYLKSKLSAENDSQEPREYFQIISQICQKDDMVIIGVIYPSFKKYAEYNSDELEAHRSILKLMRDFNWDIIDLHDYLNEKEIIAYSIGQIDDIHPNFEGQSRIADIIYDYLVKNNKLHIN